MKYVDEFNLNHFLHKAKADFFNLKIDISWAIIACKPCLIHISYLFKGLQNKIGAAGDCFQNSICTYASYAAHDKCKIEPAMELIVIVFEKIWWSDKIPAIIFEWTRAVLLCWHPQNWIAKQIGFQLWNASVCTSPKQPSFSSRALCK